MILGQRALERAFNGGTWQAYREGTQLTVDQIRIGPNSIDVTLANVLLIPAVTGTSTSGTDSIVDPKDEHCLEWHKTEIGDHGFILPPGGFVLGSVRERFQCNAALVVEDIPAFTSTTHYDADGRPVKPLPPVPRMSTFAPMYEGRSTMGRIGIASHITAGFGDYGFQGAFTLEIFNHLRAPVRLHRAMRIGQVVFEEVHSPGYYNGAYNTVSHFDGPVAPVLGASRF